MTRQRGGALRRWISHLLLLAFVARALVPAGYMPDFYAASAGVFKVVICTPVGTTTLTIADSGKPLPDQQGDHNEQPCAFAGAAAVELPALDTFQLATLGSYVSNVNPRVAVQLPPTRAGPLLGSRGPPPVL